MRISANALFVVVIISLLCFILTGALINYSFLYKEHIYADRRKLRLQHNIATATRLVLQAPEVDYLNQSAAIDLYADGEDSVQVAAQYWGVFTQFSLQALAPHDTLQRAFFKGSSLPKFCKSAIYLLDRDRPLAVSGKTRITGMCYFPAAGVKKTFVEDDSYHGDTIVYGETSESNRTMPDIDSLRFKYLNKLAEGYFPAGMVDMELDAEINNSFHNPTAFVRLGSGTLNRVSIRGNVFLYASGPITIGSTCNLEDVIVVAPSVKIENGFKGNLQVIAWDSVTVGQSATLAYPSAIILLKKTYTSAKPTIRMEADALVEGVLISWQDQEDQKRTLVSIEKGATVKGQVFSNGMVSVKGTVIGNVSAYSFYFETKTTQYENLLLGATINYTALSKQFIGGHFLKADGQTNNILKWLE